MQMVGKESWQMSMGDQEPLNFAAFIAKQENFDPWLSRPPISTAENQWREWWLALPEAIYEAEIQLKDKFSAMQGVSAPPLPEKPVKPFIGYHPPFHEAFPEEMAKLSELCSIYHESFLGWRNTREISRGDRISFPQRVEVNSLIKEFQKKYGREVKPFKLRIDFVSWPQNYLREVTPNHLVFQLLYGEREREAALRELLQSYIARLG